MASFSRRQQGFLACSTQPLASAARVLPLEEGSAHGVVCRVLLVERGSRVGASGSPPRPIQLGCQRIRSWSGLECFDTE